MRSTALTHAETDTESKVGSGNLADIDERVKQNVRSIAELKDLMKQNNGPSDSDGPVKEAIDSIVERQSFLMEKLDELIALSPNNHAETTVTVHTDAHPVAVAPLLYSGDSNKFSQTFTSCIRDPSCRILYNHIQKTGGTHLASKFYPILDENDVGERTGKQYDCKEWCCGNRLWERFQNKTESFCSLKFGVYETNTRMFGDVVKSCRRHINKRKREVVLFTVRDPIQRTLSLINMICNRSFETRSKEEQDICRRCNYDGGEGGSDSKFYDRFANDTLGIYMGFEPTILATVKLFEEMQLEEDNNGHQSHILILDNSDINSFVQDIEQQRNSTLPTGRPNFGKTNRCDFQMPPTMRKNIQPALDIYEKIVNGSFDPSVLRV